LSFGCDEPTPGSGLDQPTTGGGTVSVETAGIDFTSGGCTDFAGNVATPARHTVKVDWTAP
jgi:hypothetical protein